MKIIYKFAKKDCPSCRAIEPLWEELKKEFPSVAWNEVDTDTKEGLELAHTRAVSVIPTFLSTDGIRHNGFINKEQFINKFLKSESGHWAGLRF